MKTGGLADVSAALPKALSRLGHRVTVVLPRYGPISVNRGDLAATIQVPFDGTSRSAGLYVTETEDDVEVVFVDHAAFFDRPYPYGVGNVDYPDNAQRFAFLARAAIEVFRSRGLRPDVFHVHDWQGGLLPVFLKVFYWGDPVVGRVPTLLTIHNMAYHGLFDLGALRTLGLPWHLATPEALEFYGRASYLKAGIVFSELVSTVSPTYAEEIQTLEHGHGLEGVLRARAAELTGILNGIDTDEWDPGNDPHIVRTFTPADPSGKADCKADLLRTFGLPTAPDLPLVGIVSRLVSHKGFDLVASVPEEILRRRMRLVVLGTGERSVQDGFRAAAAADPTKVSTRFTYDQGLAHKVEAGADMLLMPSRSEPCGLTQMYALRYGTVPIVRATGGLVDSVEPYDPATGDGTGFRFAEADSPSLFRALDEALVVHGDRERWRRLMENGMTRDFSWSRSARAYVDLYRGAALRA